MTQWSEPQRAALKALKIPLFELKRNAAAPVTEVQTAPEPTLQEPPSPEPTTQWLYQVGVWTLLFPTELPVPRYRWLEDLCRAYDTRPTRVNAIKDTRMVVDCREVSKSELSPVEKQKLWAQLKPLLNL